jgi:predicted aspartyl protease
MLMVLMSVAVSACALVADGSKPLRFDLRNHAIVVAVHVDDHGPFRFLLDTGASRSLISSDIAARVRAAAITRTMMITPAGHSIRPVVSVSLAVGDRTAVRVAATVVTPDDLSRGELEVDGVLGQDVLSPLAYTIDYRRREIHWHAHPTDISERLPLEFADGRALVSLQQGGRPFKLIPDTGSDGVVIFERPGASWPDATPLDVGLLRTLSGHQLVRRVTIDDFRVAARRLRNVSAVVVPNGHERLLQSDGLLPLHLFSAVVVNGREGYLAVR